MKILLFMAVLCGTLVWRAKACCPGTNPGVAYDTCSTGLYSLCGANHYCLYCKCDFQCKFTVPPKDTQTQANCFQPGVHYTDTYPLASTWINANETGHCATDASNSRTADHVAGTPTNSSCIFGSLRACSPSNCNGLCVYDSVF
jgi:hypothetical protein